MEEYALRAGGSSLCFLMPGDSLSWTVFYSIISSLSATENVASVFAFTSSTVRPGAISVRVSVPRFRSTWKTHFNFVSNRL